MQTTINVFRKPLPNTNPQQFILITKNKNGQTCQVEFKGEAKTKLMNEKPDAPFTITVERNKIGYSEKQVFNEDKTPKVNRNSEPIFRRKFFIDDIVSIGEYVREDISEDII